MTVSLVSATLLPATLVGAAVLASLGLPACGSRSELDVPAPRADGQPTQACRSDAECVSVNACQREVCQAGACVAVQPPNCDDADPCTVDGCDAATGACSHAPLTADRDGDGVAAPLAGLAPGAPGSCGADCDDTRADVRPGAEERCDGVDNDCDGRADFGDSVGAITGVPQLLTPLGAGQSNNAGATATSDSIVLSVSAQSARWGAWFAFPAGEGAATLTEVTRTASDSFAGPVVWNGAELATAWEDRRNDNYEIYFARFDRSGNKLAADLQVSAGAGFSLHPSLLWTGEDYLVAWDDRRAGDDQLQVFTQRLSAAGTPIDGNRPLTVAGALSESPKLALGSRTLGVAYRDGPAGESRVLLLRLDRRTLEPLGDAIPLSGGGATAPELVYVAGRYALAWTTRIDGFPGPTVQGAVVDEDGVVRAADVPLTGAAPHARSPSLLPLGDRLLLAWSDDSLGNYEVFSRMVGLDLSFLGPPERLTDEPEVSVRPQLVAGPGRLGLVFDDRRGGVMNAYYLDLECRAQVDLR